MWQIKEVHATYFSKAGSGNLKPFDKKHVNYDTTSTHDSELPFLASEPRLRTEKGLELSHCSWVDPIDSLSLE
jgi:hypothetical protein